MTNLCYAVWEVMKTMTAKVDKANIRNTVTVIRATGACGLAGLAGAGFLATGLLAVGAGCAEDPVGTDRGAAGANGAGRTGNSPAWGGAGAGTDLGAAGAGAGDCRAKGFGGAAGLFGAAISITGLVGAVGFISRWQ